MSLVPSYYCIFPVFMVGYSRWLLITFAALLAQLERAIAEVCERSGWGEIRLIIERGKLRRVVVVSSIDVATE